MLLYTHSHTHTHTHIRVYAHKHAHTSILHPQADNDSARQWDQGLAISPWAGREAAGRPAPQSDGSSALTWLLLFSFRPLNSISASAEPSL